MKNIIFSLQQLYNYGEIGINRFAIYYQKWLQNQNWLIKKKDIFLISDRWIELSYLTNDRKSFINHLLLFLPQYKKYFLAELLKVGLEIAKSEDENGLIKYINSLSKFASDILQLYHTLNSEYYKDLIELNNNDWKEIKESYRNDLTDQIDQYIFGGNIDFSRLIRMLDLVQKIENKYNTFNIYPLEKLNVSKNWTAKRRITTNPSLKPTKSIHYTLVPIKNKFNYPGLEITEYLNNPWGLFLILLGMIEKQLRAEDNNRISICPDLEEPYQPNSISYFTYIDNGQEVYVSSLEEFIKGFLAERGLRLFPAKELNLTNYFIELVEADIYEYKNNEYILTNEIDSLLYDKPLLNIKNEAKELTNHLKNYVERLAKSYED